MQIICDNLSVGLVHIQTIDNCLMLQVGVRKAMLSGGALFGSGLAIAGAGAHTHNAGL